MKVILKENVESLGKIGEVIKVADGYARNYLLPKRLAVAATEANKNIVEQERQAALRREAVERGQAEEQGKLLSSVVLVSVQKAGDQDQLFGSVTAKDIADLLAKQGFEIDRRKIVLPEPIKTLGEHTINIKLFRDVVAPVKLQVNKEEEAQPTKAE